MTMTPAERTIAAEARAVEEGHQARRSEDGRYFLVRSDTVDSRDYRVRVTAGPDCVLFTCDHAAYLGGSQARRTVVPCKHGARAARRLEREGLIRWDGDRWLATDKAAQLAPPQPEDPFEDLPC